MPQLDPSSFPSQLFWLGIVFFLLYFFMAKFAVPRITGVMQNRRDRIVSDLEKAEKLKKEADDLNSEYLSSVQEVRIKANAIIAKAVSKAKKDEEEQNSELDIQLQKKFQEMEADITKARAEALKNIGEVATDLSRLVVDRLAGVQVAKKDAANTVKSLLKEVE